MRPPAGRTTSTNTFAALFSSRSAADINCFIAPASRYVIIRRCAAVFLANNFILNFFLTTGEKFNNHPLEIRCKTEVGREKDLFLIGTAFYLSFAH